jgi:hypothetical protein
MQVALLASRSQFPPLYAGSWTWLDTNSLRAVGFGRGFSGGAYSQVARRSSRFAGRVVVVQLATSVEFSPFANFKFE